MRYPYVMLFAIALAALGSAVAITLVARPDPAHYLEAAASAEKPTVDEQSEALPAPALGDTRTFAGIEFVWIESGAFLMGASMAPADVFDRYGGDLRWYENEIPRHTVTLTKGFWLGKYEVTQAQWKRSMEDNPSDQVGDDLPVESISWNDTQAFIARLNEAGDGVFRLPTEAEWEFA
ncbi:MAG TPA: formylglycine-generating enzyme family protein, partial [Candidatus Hydrogenedentes bacterium]|nr:formylglycine-generating enzyme family protein [Candidatus Hydrogenedentota bacterium]